MVSQGKVWLACTGRSCLPCQAGRFLLPPCLGHPGSWHGRVCVELGRLRQPPRGWVAVASCGCSLLMLPGRKQIRQPGLGPRRILKVLAGVSAHLELCSLSWNAETLAGRLWMVTNNNRMEKSCAGLSGNTWSSPPVLQIGKRRSPKVPSQSKVTGTQVCSSWG